MLTHQNNKVTTPFAPIAPRRIRFGGTSAPASSCGPALHALFLIGASLAAIASPSFARAADCSISYSFDDRIFETIERISFEGYDALCPALEAAHLKVSIEANKGVLNDRAFAWVNIRLMRTSTSVSSDLYSSTTKISTPADEETASKTLLDAINDSLASIATEKDKYIQSVAAEEARLRASLTSNSTDAR